MASKQSSGEHAARAEGGGRTRAAGESSAPEPRDEPSPPARYGPLELVRMRKADGRALLIYRHARERGEPPA